ncbi:hypothetical protein L210DRAFT_985643 [Boletus edulis BED1]|uniref:Uncharacterized protein n=1 Tax=Boletus edulis BED1 TaxID=1328754 RepID=A0AAD4GK91_BOLED|nr:hypothetical protein L210DRAFT_985643 [Boletus edulis BED1]
MDLSTASSTPFPSSHPPAIPDDPFGGTPSPTPTSTTPTNVATVPQTMTQASSAPSDLATTLGPPPAVPLPPSKVQAPSAPAHPAPPPVLAPTPSRLKAHLAMATENRRNAANQALPLTETLPVHTPKPIDGFPMTHLRHSAQLFDDMDKDCVIQWDERVPEPKLLFRIFDFNVNKATQEAIQTALHKVRKVISSIAYEYQDAVAIKIAPPTRATDAKTAPVTFLAYGLLLVLQTILLDTRVWVTPDVTFEVFPFGPTFPTFLFALAGFVDAESAEAYSVILQTWNTDQMYDAYIGIITQDARFPVDATEEAQMQWLTASFHQMLDSLRVTFLDVKLSGNVPAPRFNIFAELPTEDPKAWHEIHDLLEKMIYTNPLHGTAARAPLRPCAICHCVTHPRGLCPFPRLDEWHGPQINPPAPVQPPPQPKQRRNKDAGRR